jgi:hypothetical protein
MKKLVAVLFGLLVVAGGFAAATIWKVTAVRDYSQDQYAEAYAEIGVSYDLQHPFTNYDITYRTGWGKIKDSYSYPYYVFKNNLPNGVEVNVYVMVPGLSQPDVVSASATWPYI